MTRAAVSIALATVAGIASVALLPAGWLGTLALAALAVFFVFVILVRLNTKTEPSANQAVRILLFVVNLPEQPLAKVAPGWALTTCFSLAVFMVSLGITIMVFARV